MSTSLAVVNGDLVVGPGRRFDTVSGKAKLKQDLELWILEKIGTDPSFLNYGSHLDEFIGTIIGPDTTNRIRNEILRVIQQYQSIQYNRVRTETIQLLGKSTLEADEIINTIDSVDVRSVGTMIVAQVKITTLGGTSMKLTLPVTDIGVTNA